MKTEIIYEDRDILVIYKPAGLATQTAKLGQADVVSELKNYLIQRKRESKNTAEAGGGDGQGQGRKPDSPYLGIVHRLDQPVEGLLVFGKNKKATAVLSAQLKSGESEVGLHKRYYAVLCGKPDTKEGVLVDEMYKSAENLAVIVERTAEANKSRAASRKESVSVAGENMVAGQSQIKEARLRYRIVEVVSPNDTGLTMQQDAKNQEISLADIEIYTGRFHQIRAQMAHAGLPLLGDLRYGDEPSKELARKNNVRNVALCAYALEVLHPVTRKKLEFKIEPRGIAFSLFGAHEK